MAVPRVDPTPPVRQEPTGLTPGELRFVLVLMCTALALVVGATSSLSVAQPDISRAIGATQTELTWVINAYVLAFAALLLPAGIATDKYGRCTALTIGISVFAAACVGSAFATTPEALIALRFAAGLGATFVMPATLSVLVDAFPPERREAAVAVWAGVTGAGALLGVALAGVLLNAFEWGSIQLFYGGAAVLLVPAVLEVVPNVRNPALHLDLPGAAASAVGLAGLVYGVIQGPDQGWGDPLTVTGLVVGGLGLTAFVIIELLSRDPMLDVRLFRSHALAAGSILVLLLSAAVFGFFLLGPQFLQEVKGYSSLEAALRLLPFAVGIGPASQLAPRLTARLGSRWIGSVGAGTMAAGLTIFALTADGPYWNFAVGLVVTGAGMGLALTTGTTLIINGLPADRRTLSSAVNDVTREVGGAVGGAVVGSLLVTLFGDKLKATLLLVPDPIADIADKGVGAAVQVAHQAGAVGPALINSAQYSFTYGFRGAMLLDAAIVLVCAVITGFLTPK